MRLKLGFLLSVFFAAAVPSYAYRVSVWIPAWDENGLASMQQNAGNVQESNPGWYTITADGGVAKNWNAEDPRLRAAISGTQLLPTIKNYVNDRFDGKLVATIVASSDLREKHAEAITQLVVQNAFDGIDIDYESLPLSARSNFTSFIQLLGSKLHSARKKLSVTVHAKTSDQGEWSAAAAQDWNAIGAAADSVKIMAYDYHYSSSTAGPIAPLSWLDGVATYAESVIPSNKIMMGLPWYGYDWTGNAGSTVVYSQAMGLAQRAGATIDHDSNGEATFAYNGRVVFFQDATSYSRKVAMLKDRHSGIGGFAHWRAGAEDPAIWNVIAGLNGGGSTTNPVTPAPAPPAGSFEVSVQDSVTVNRGSSVDVTIHLNAIDGYSDRAGIYVDAIDAFPGNVTLLTTSVSATEPATLRIIPVAGATGGTYRLRIRATNGNLSSERVLNVRVATPRRRAVR